MNQSLLRLVVPAGLGARGRTQTRAAISAAIGTATPIATCMCATIGLLTAETMTRITESVKSRRKSSSVVDGVMLMFDATAHHISST